MDDVADLDLQEVHEEPNAPDEELQPPPFDLDLDDDATPVDRFEFVDDEVPEWIDGAEDFEHFRATEHQARLWLEEISGGLTAVSSLPAVFWEEDGRRISLDHDAALVAAQAALLHPVVIGFARLYRPDTTGLLAPVRLLLNLPGVVRALEFEPASMLRDLLLLPARCNGRMNRYWAAALALAPELSAIELPDHSFDPGEVVDVLVPAFASLRALFSSAGPVEYPRFGAVDGQIEPLRPVLRERFAFTSASSPGPEGCLAPFSDAMTTASYLILDVRPLDYGVAAAVIPSEVTATDGSRWQHVACLCCRFGDEEGLELDWVHCERPPEPARGAVWYAFDTSLPVEPMECVSADLAFFGRLPLSEWAAAAVASRGVSRGEPLGNFAAAFDQAFSRL
jgi:hypothetical protein